MIKPTNIKCRVVYKNTQNIVCFGFQMEQLLIRCPSNMFVKAIMTL